MVVCVFNEPPNTQLGLTTSLGCKNNINNDNNEANTTTTMHPLGVKAALWLAFSSVAAALGQEKIISTNSHGSVLQLAGNGPKAGQILVAENEYWGVIRAAGDLAVDFGRVTGTNLTLSNGKKGKASAAARYEYKPVDNTNNTVVSSPV